MDLLVRLVVPPMTTHTHHVSVGHGRQRMRMTGHIKQASPVVGYRRTQLTANSPIFAHSGI